MNKIVNLLLIVCLLAPTICIADCCKERLCNDTIDYGNKRLILEVPEFSLKNSAIIDDSEGLWITYPFLSDKEQLCGVVIEYSGINFPSLLYTKDYDIELWNTLNKSWTGSRCYKKNGLYYRIDSFDDGLRIYYEDVPEDLINTFDSILKSVFKKYKTPSDKPLKDKKRKQIYTQ